MLYGQGFKLCDPGTNSDASKMLLPGKSNNIMNHFCVRWKKEYLVNLREYQKLKHSNKHQQIVDVKDIFIIQKDKMPQSTWKLGIVVEVIKGTHGNIQAAVVRIPRTKYLINRSANKLISYI